MKIAVALLASTVCLGQSLEGVWIGSLGSGDRSVPIVFVFEKGSDGGLGGQVISPVRGSFNPLGNIAVNGERVKAEAARIRALFEGVLDTSGKRLHGVWTQPGVKENLLLTRREVTSVRAPLPREVEVFTEAAPVAVPSAGRFHLLYDVHVANWSAADVEMTRLEILVDAKPLRIEGTLLKAWTYRNQTEIAPQGRATIFVVLSSSERPHVVSHRVTLKRSGEPDLVVASGDSKVVHDVMLIAPPLRGGVWVAGAGPDVHAHHRTTVIPVNGRIVTPQRFAFDFYRDSSSEAAPGEPTDNARHASYGAEVVAVADATVVAAVGGIADNVPNDVFLSAARTGDWMLGNHVVLDLGGNRFALYAHLQPQVTVRVGERVRSGQVLGKLGNSGSSNTPHLHFQITNGRGVFTSEGTPFVFKSFRKDGQIRTREMPLNGWKVEF